MSAYTGPIQTALIIFGIAVFILFIPWLVYTYRKYGFLSLSKTLIVFSFIFYFLAALFLVLLPLPETTNTCAIQRPDTKFYNLQPFKFLDDIKRNTTIAYTDISSWSQIIRQPSFYQAFFNFLLLMPLGVYIRYFFKERKFWLRAFLMGLGLSLFYEVTQVTGIYGIYNCPYRIFDVDDLILNSTGALFGFVIAPIILAIFPKHQEVVEKAQAVQMEHRIKPLHYLVALFVDFFIVSFIAGIFTKDNTFLQDALTIGLYVVTFMIVPMITRGQTLGMKLVKIKLVKPGENIVENMNLIRRTFAIIAVYILFVIMRILNQVELNMDSPFYHLQIVVTLISFTVVIVAMLVIAWHVLRFLFSKNKRKLFFDDYAKVEVVRKK